VEIKGWKDAEAGRRAVTDSAKRFTDNRETKTETIV
jgi:hypothetical protein